jgi:hypothetical protein
MTEQDIKDIEHKTVIIAYLASKFPELEENWFINSNPSFFGRTPQEIVYAGMGDMVIEYLEVRLGLRPGAAF